MTEDATIKAKRAEYQRKWRDANPERAKAIAKKSRSKHRSAHRERSRKYYEGHRDEHRAYKRQRQYQLTQEQYSALLSQQNGSCAICMADSPGGKGDWHVDHCHDTGVVRGLLCHGCNTGLGLFKDNYEALLRAASYLRAENT